MHLRQKQSGRSMIEMLGILVIVGVLSVAALFGFTYAMNKYRANETIHDVMLRATNVPMIDEFYKDRPNNPVYYFEFPDLGDYSSMGYLMLTSRDDAYGYVYRVDSEVPKKVCSLILKMEPTDIDEIRVNNVLFSKTNTDICSQDVNEMTFLFEKSCLTTADCNNCQVCHNHLCRADYHRAECGQGGVTPPEENDPCLEDPSSHACLCKDEPTRCATCQLESKDENGCRLCEDTAGCVTCSNDTSCPDNQECRNGYCEDPIPCNVDTDCDSPSVCINSICKEPECTTNEDCPENNTCTDRICVPSDTCEDDKDCVAPEVCINGICKEPECTTNEDCPENNTCTDYICVPSDTCEDDKDCVAPEICIDGVCQEPECQSTEDCPEGEICVEGRCEPGEENNCETDSDCPENSICMITKKCRSCVDGYKTYCAKYTQFLEEGAGQIDGCSEIGCSTNLSCHQERVDNDGTCCAEDNFAYSVGPNLYLGCCNGNVYCYRYEGDECVQYNCRANCTPFRSSETWGDCCQDAYTLIPVADGLSACCSSSYNTAYCSAYNPDTDQCQSTTCASNCTPYRITATRGGCCQSGYEVVDMPNGYQACVPEGRTPYCSLYEDGVCVKADYCTYASYDNVYCRTFNEDGSCLSEGCTSSDCPVYRKDKYTAEPCCSPKTVEVIDGVEFCLSTPQNCSSGYTPYFEGSYYKCCYDSEVIIDVRDSIQVCCASSQEGYCTGNKNDGTCSGANCCSQVVYDVEDGVQVCAAAGAAPYCRTYSSQGYCLAAGVCLSGEPYRSNKGSSPSCCTKTIATVPGTDLKACCDAGQTGGCTQWTNGECVAVGCCDGTVAYFGTNRASICVPDGYAGYCRTYDEAGNCLETTTCRGEPYQINSLSWSCCTQNVVSIGASVSTCCADGVEAYCESRDQNGTCLSAYCCSAGWTPYNYSQTSDSCCSPSNILTESFDGVQGCIPEGATPYCSVYVDGKCNRVAYSLNSGGCTPYRKSATEGGCCGSTPIKSGDYYVCYD